MNFSIALRSISMPQSLTQSQHFTWVFLLIFFIAFFPGFPQYLLSLPLTLVWPASLPTPPPIICPAGCESASANPDLTMSWFQKTFTLPSRSRGSYLITDDVVSQLPELKNYKVGILHLFVQHTSCGLSLNENWDDDVRADMSDALDRIAPEDRKGNLYRHSCEGPDDMPVSTGVFLPLMSRRTDSGQAHIKSALVGASVTVPISNGKLATGTWQGIWYLEFRASKHTRKVVATIQGEKA